MQSFVWLWCKVCSILLGAGPGCTAVMQPSWAWPYLQHGIVIVGRAFSGPESGRRLVGWWVGVFLNFEEEPPIPVL